MRAVADTNLVISGLLWKGPCRQALDAARDGRVSLFTSPPLLAELADVLQRDKFNLRLISTGISASELVHDYAALASVVRPAPIGRVVLEDPDDDEVIACAIGASAALIISGDSHLLNLKRFRNVEIVSVAEFLKMIK